jgi:TPR repeat protein
MAEICAELSRVDRLVFAGSDAGRVRCEAARLPLSQSGPKVGVKQVAVRAGRAPAAVQVRAVAQRGGEQGLDGVARARVLYEAGIGLSKEGKAVEAAGKFEQAAELGGVQAASGWARCLHDGCGVKINLREALRFARWASAGEDPVGLAVLGRMLRREEGTARDRRQGAEFARKAAAAGSPFGLAE